MKLTAASLLVLWIAFVSCQSNKETAEHQHSPSTEAVPADTIRKSIPREAHAQIGKAHLMIKYHAPAVRGRMIWGGLVPYNEVWVTGAHSATSLETDRAIVVGGTEVPAGKYALFTIPGESKWTVIINRNWEQHLADEYDVQEDVLRLDVTPVVRDAVQERLTYSIVADHEAAGNIHLRWEKMLVSLPFEVR